MSTVGALQGVTGRERREALRVSALLVVGSILLYTAGYLAWYSGTPLGLVPMADEREILALAVAIASGELPPEAFYRAPGYPALLALGLKLGWPQADLALGARLLNGLCHLVSSWLCYRLANRLWKTPVAGLLAATLVGLNPVLLHFAGDALDITLAITLMLGGLTLLWGRSTPLHGASSFCLAFAGLCRPQLLALLVVPLLARRSRHSPRLAGLWPALIVLGAFGLVNQHLSGDFRVLPWQGAFNLWAANHAGSNGRYFAQTRSIDAYGKDANTARIESEILYREANPGAPDDYRTITRWWQAQALAAVVADPLAWAARMAAKLRYLVNNEEQYNNKTFAFHKDLSPWLRPNPLCWAVVFVAGLAGLAVRPQTEALRGLGCSIAVLAAATLVFYVSDRFRAPLVPLLAVAAGGLVCLQRGTTRLPALVAACVATASLWPVGYTGEETRMQDHLLVARSADVLQRHALALQHADAAVALAPALPAARSTRCVVAFNAWLAEASDANWEQDCERAAASSQSARLLAGYAAWRRGDSTLAIERWRSLGGQAGPFRSNALAALWWTGALGAGEEVALRQLANGVDGLVLRITAAARGERGAREALESELGPARSRREIAAVERLWSTPPR